MAELKNSAAPCSLTESKQPSSNTLGEADVLQGPHSGHRHGRKKRCVCHFLTRFETWLQNVVFEYSYFLVGFGEAKNVINCTDLTAEGFLVCVLYTDLDAPYLVKYTTTY